MKTLYRPLLFLLTVFHLFSCTDENIIDKDTIIEGAPADVTLTFNVNTSDKIVTRAAQSTYYEYLVQNIYIFVFNNDERIDLTQDYFESNEITNYKNKEDDKGNTQSSGTIDFGAVSGSNLKICAIANIGTSNSVITTEVLDKISTYSQLSELAVALGNNTIFRGASFLMTGEETVNLRPEGKTELTINLKRTDSKITFNVQANSDTYSDMQFIPGKWRVVNVPSKTWVLPRVTTGQALTGDSDAATEGDFFSIAENEMPQFEGTDGNSGTFTFYMYENLKTPARKITDNDIPAYSTTFEGNAKYALREKQEKDTPGEGVTTVPHQRFVNGDYVYAPQYGTYVVFTGELSYTQKNASGNDEYVMADVEYCVHLGHSGTANVNDYSTFRNSHYTYNVTITGVNSLIVEVDSNDGTNDQEERPGAEGDVVISAAQIVNVDAHYDRAIFSLTDTEAEKIYFAVSTPYERGLDANGFATSGTLKDYKWVKFLINKEAEVSEEEYAPYPGEQCYDGGKTSTGTAAKSTAYNNKTITLRDVRQLSFFLADNTNRNNVKSNDGEIYITAFIDEYLYFYNPNNDPLGENTTYKGITQGTDNTSLSLWKQSVNQNDRMLHVVKAGDMKYSADGETSVSRSVITFKQRPILTFYNVNASGLTSAWGTETINETPKMTVTRTSYPDQGDMNYYVYSQTLTAGTNRWANVITTSDKYALGNEYNDPSYACALRNRDLNGNGTIDKNEVQWYLASLDQMSDLWIGEPCMPKYAHLYDEDNPDGTYTMKKYTYNATHFSTSTILGTSPKIYWAEEYGANSTQSQAEGWSQAPKHNNKYIVSLRCVRNLGISYNETDTPQDYVVVENGTPNASITQNTSNEYKINLAYINPVALRSTPDYGISLAYAHLNSTTENNRPYSSFFVNPDYYGTGKNQGNTTWYKAYSGEISTDSEKKLCPKGYRVPNQRELLIMSRTIDGWDWNRGGENSVASRYLTLNGQVIKVKEGNSEKYFWGVFYFYNRQARIGRAINSEAVDTEQGIDYSTAGNGDYYGTSAVIRCVKDYY